MQTNSAVDPETAYYSVNDDRAIFSLKPGQYSSSAGRLFLGKY